MIRKVRGKTKYMYLPIAASIAAVNGTLMAFSSGTLIIATSTTAPSTIIGVLRHTIATTDANYAVAKMVEIEVPVENYVEWEMNYDGSNSLVAADIGLFCDITTASSSTVPSTCNINRGASTYDVVQVVGILDPDSTTPTNFKKARVVLNTGVAGCGVIGA